jgi:hypothetical protein
MPIKIKFNTSVGDTLVTIFNDAQNQNFQFNVDGDPQSIVFDYGNWILKNLSPITQVDGQIVPDEFSLEQNYPNPFNPSTTLEYALGSKAYVTLKIFNILGKEVTTLVNVEQDAGSYVVEFDASKLESGVYFYSLEATPRGGQAGVFAETKKMILMK